MDVRVLKYFLEVVDKGNITKAAESLHITQPTLSRQLMDLEEEVGTRLFVRGKRKIELTNAGYEYHQYAKEIVRLLDKASEVADVNHLEVSGVLIEPVEAAKYERIKLSVKDRWGILVSSEHPLAKYETVTIEQVIKEPLVLTSRDIVMDEMIRWLGVGKKELKIFGSHNLLTNSLALIKKGLVITITVEGAYAIRETDGFVFVPLDDERVSSHVIAWKKLKEKSKLAALFIEQIEESEELK